MLLHVFGTLYMSINLSSNIVALCVGVIQTFRIMVGHNIHVLATQRCSRLWSHYIDCHKLKGPSSWEISKLTFLLRL